MTASKSVSVPVPTLEIVRRIPPERRSDPAVFRKAVEAWCERFEWPAEVAGLAPGLDDLPARFLGRVARLAADQVLAAKHGEHLSLRVNDALRGVFLRQALEENDDDYIEAVTERAPQMTPEDYGLMALFAAALGYLWWGERRRSRGPPERGTEKPDDARRPSPAAPSLPRCTLVLVVNAERSQVIEGLEAGGLDALEGDALYRATQAMWFGSERDFRQSDLAPWFATGRQVDHPSEYDVRLVRIDVEGDDAGLHRNANQLDRLDAFRRLRSGRHVVVVSARLPSEAYDSSAIYGR